MEISKIEIRIRYKRVGYYRLPIIVLKLLVLLKVIRKVTIKHWFLGKRE